MSKMKMNQKNNRKTKNKRMNKKDAGRNQLGK